MKEGMMSLMDYLCKNQVIQIVLVCIVLDTVFGVLRAIKERKLNSNFGINGAIRKVGMVISVVALACVDAIVQVNFIGFIPKEARECIRLEHVGTMEFFGMLYICYEIISILKNMTLCGLPVGKVLTKVQKVLRKYTDELVDYDQKEGGTDELRNQETES